MAVDGKQTDDKSSCSCGQTFDRLLRPTTSSPHRPKSPYDHLHRYTYTTANVNAATRNAPPNQHSSTKSPRTSPTRSPRRARPTSPSSSSKLVNPPFRTGLNPLGMEMRLRAGASRSPVRGAEVSQPRTARGTTSPRGAGSPRASSPVRPGGGSGPGSTYVAEREKLKHAIQKRDEQIKALNDMNLLLLERLEEGEAEVSTAANKDHVYTREIEELRIANEKLLKAEASKDEQILALHQQVSDMREECDLHAKEAQLKGDMISQLREQVAKLQHLSTPQFDTQLDDVVDELKEHCAKLETEIEQKDDLLVTVSQELRRKTDEVQRKEDEVAALSKENDKLSTEVDRLHEANLMARTLGHMA